MNKKVLALVAGLTMAANVGFAAPNANVSAGETSIGYNYYGLSHSTDNSSYNLQTGLTDKLSVGIERNNFKADSNDKWHNTDVYAQYKLDPSVHLIVGNRDYSYHDSKVYAGIGFSTNLAPKLDGYASVIANSFTTEWQAGVNYALSDKATLNVGYKSTKDDGYSTYDGVGVGVNFKF